MTDSAETMRAAEIGRCYKIGHDGFVGTVIGHYTTTEGKEGVVLQQVGTKVVHVYGRKWIAADAALSATKSDGNVPSNDVLEESRIDPLPTSERQDGGAQSRPAGHASQPDEVEAIARLLTAAKLLQQNAVGCTTNHYGYDCEMNGLPGWLADTKKDIDAAEDAILAMQAERQGDNTIQRDKIYRAAERSNTRFGQWIPERWVNIFVEEMSK